jgi:hypothetical protein
LFYLLTNSEAATYFLKNIKLNSYDIDMLLKLISDLRTALVVIVFIGFIAFGVLLIVAEHRVYVLHIEGKFKFSKVLYWLAVLLTAGALIVIYRIFFLRIYTAPATLNPTAYV